MVAGEVCCGFFQELVFHLQFPVFPLELAQPCAVTYSQRRLFAGMLTAINTHPVTEGTFVDPSSFATLAIGRDVSITIFTASSLNSGEKLFLVGAKISPFQTAYPNG